MQWIDTPFLSFYVFAGINGLPASFVPSRSRP